MTQGEERLLEDVRKVLEVDPKYVGDEAGLINDNDVESLRLHQVAAFVKQAYYEGFADGVRKTKKAMAETQIDG